MMSLALDMALDGDLHEVAERYKVAYLTAVKEAGTTEARDFIGELRVDVVAAHLGQAVANAWRLETYPAGMKLSYEPAWFIHSNAATIIEAFTRGGTISARHRQALAVPIPGSPAYDLKLRRGSSRVAEVIRRYGPLAEVITRRGVVMLVATLRGSNAGGLRPLTQRSTKDGHRFSPLNQRRVEVPMFWVARNIRLEQRLHWPTIARRRERSFAENVESRLRTRFREAESHGVDGTVGSA